jgi:hypothetical protein
MNFLIAPRKGVLVFAMAILMAGCGGGGGDMGSAGVTGGGVEAGGGDMGAGVSGDGEMGSAGATGGGVAAGGVGAPGTLFGHVVSITDFHGAAPDHTTVLGPHSTTVGDGIELVNGFGNFATIDISGASIRITAAADQPFGYFEVFRFADANGTISPIASVTIDPATNYAGFNVSRLTFTADNIDLNLTNLSGQQGQQILLNIVFASP